MTLPDFTALLQAARKSWDERFDRPPLQMGVEEGIVWAVVAGPVSGVNGYAMIPAEGHPWSNGFPRGEDMTVDQRRSRANMKILHDIMQRRGITGRDPDDMAAVFQEAKNTSGYEEPPEGYGMDDFLEVHGGITYYHHPWVGFDTAHAWDYWPPEFDPSGISRRFHSVDSVMDKHWTVELVIEEARDLCRQVAEIGVLERQLDISMGVLEGGAYETELP